MGKITDNTLSLKYITEYKDAYLHQLKGYLVKELAYCQNNSNEYTKITIEYIKEIITGLPGFANSDADVYDVHGYVKRDFKYNDFIEAYRLIKYQYSKYSNRNYSLVEGVYSSIVLEILKNQLTEVCHVLDCGCGPSRLTYELSTFYKNADFVLLDFSYLNLFFANKLLKREGFLSIPSKSFGATDVEHIKIASKYVNKLSSYIFNLDNLSTDTFDYKFDIITASHSINLLSDPLKTINTMTNMLKKGGIMVISDLLGWKENRDVARRVFYNRESFFEKISAIPGISVLHKESGGPYCEEVNAERYDIYTNHFIVLRRD